MKYRLYTLLLFVLLSQNSKSHAQCPIPNNDFSGYWLNTLYVNWSESYDTEKWNHTWKTAYNAYYFFTPGIFPAAGTSSSQDAVEFNLQGVPEEVGIKSSEPIGCSDIPSGLRGKFKHDGNLSDTLFFSVHLSAVDVSGDTVREVITAHLIANTPVGPNYQHFEIYLPKPLQNGYTQIDSLVIVFKSKASNPGKFFLDEVDFIYPISMVDNPLSTQLVRMMPTLVQSSIHIELLNPMSDWQVSIADMEGNVLHTKQVGMEQGIDLEIEHFKSGVYIVICRDSDGQMIFAKRIVKI